MLQPYILSKITVVCIQCACAIFDYTIYLNTVFNKLKNTFKKSNAFQNTQQNCFAEVKYTGSKITAPALEKKSKDFGKMMWVLA